MNNRDRLKISEEMFHKSSAVLRKLPATAVLSALGCLVSLTLAVVVQASLLQASDESALIAMRTPGSMNTVIGPEWLTGFWCGVTHLGGYVILTSVTLLVCLGLHLKQERKAAAGFAGTVLGGYVVNLLLKVVISRPRPDVVPQLTSFDSWSYPSGHAMMSTIVFLSLALMWGDRISGRVMRRFATGTAAALAVTVGFSRICLGVHYPSDVIAGLCAGLVWVLVFRTVVRQRRGGRAAVTVCADGGGPSAKIG